jgi:hypothetical protein
LPAAWQLAAAHVPPVHVALQQSLESEQFWPAVRHASPSQKPAEHDMLQQSVYDEHEAPPARHLPAGPESLVLESPPPLPSSALAPLLPPLPLPPSLSRKPLPLALLLPPHPSPDAATMGRTAKNVKTAQERLIAPTLISDLSPDTKPLERYSLKQSMGRWMTM